MKEFPEGSLINGRYQVQSKVGEGGQAIVYKTSDIANDGRLTAVKVVAFDGGSEGGDALNRMATEYAVLRKLSHPNIVTAHEAGRIDERLCYFAMEFVDGETLSRRIEKAGDGLPFPDLLLILREIALGLQCAHGSQVIHRDLKPANILIGSDGAVKIVDFGLAKDIELGHTMTKTGDTVGTAYYMSPEQLTRTQKLDHRTDIYAFGIVAFEMATGQSPFRDGAYIDIARAHLTQRIPRFAGKGFEIPEWYGNLVGVCTQKKPADRFQSMGEILSQLESRMRKLGLVEGPAEQVNPVKRFLLKLVGEQ